MRGTSCAHFLPLSNAGSSLGLLSTEAGVIEPFILKSHTSKAAQRLVSAEDTFSKRPRATHGSELKFICPIGFGVLQGRLQPQIIAWLPCPQVQAQVPVVR